mmetsp:Transcript_29195/g.82367  ORF Transcript_29195/g.82367 Transcript_29195/m.82367 type:complete len:286 (+) Transcript_29195:77-934(+)
MRDLPVSPEVTADFVLVLKAGARRVDAAGVAAAQPVIARVVLCILAEHPPPELAVKGSEPSLEPALDANNVLVAVLIEVVEAVNGILARVHVAYQDRSRLVGKLGKDLVQPALVVGRVNHHLAVLKPLLVKLPGDMDRTSDEAETVTQAGGADVQPHVSLLEEAEGLLDVGNTGVRESRQGLLNKLRIGPLAKLLLCLDLLVLIGGLDDGELADGDRAEGRAAEGTGRWRTGRHGGGPAARVGRADGGCRCERNCAGHNLRQGENTQSNSHFCGLSDCGLVSTSR